MKLTLVAEKDIGKGYWTGIVKNISRKEVDAIINKLEKEHEVKEEDLTIVYDKRG